jgi:hypothetical protein
MGDTPVSRALEEWLESCKGRNGTISRNTVAMGIVVLDHLLQACPVVKSAVLSTRGEVAGSRSGLPKKLAKYGIPEEPTYLREVTTRQGHQDGQRLFELLGWGANIAAYPPKKRDQYLNDGIQTLVALAKAWLSRQALKVNFDGRLSPAAWIESILEQAKGRSGGKVEQHLIGAKLATRHRDVEVQNHPSHAGDVQTGRPGDFIIGTTSYHVTAHPGRDVIKKCAANIRAGLHPLLLVPRVEVQRARVLAEEEGVLERFTIVAIEDFVAINIIELAVGDQAEFINTLKEIIVVYNERLEKVETDLSLKIELQ